MREPWKCIWPSSGCLQGQATPPTGEFFLVSAGLALTSWVRTGGSTACWVSDHSGQDRSATAKGGCHAGVSKPIPPQNSRRDDLMGASCCLGGTGGRAPFASFRQWTALLHSLEWAQNISQMSLPVSSVTKTRNVRILADDGMALSLACPLTDDPMSSTVDCAEEPSYCDSVPMGLEELSTCCSRTFSRGICFEA